MQRLLKSGTVGAVLPNGGRIHHYVSCNDSLGRRHVELNETFLGDGHDEPEQNLLRSAGRAFSGSEVFDDLFWGRGTAALIAVRSKIDNGIKDLSPMPASPS